MCKVFKLTVFRFCPNCGHEISGVEAVSLRCNLDCPDCGQKKFSEFDTVRMIDNES